MFSSLFTPSDTIYKETPPIHFGTRTVMRNDSTGQFEGRECLEGASSLSAAWFEGTGLLQHGSYAIGYKRKTRENLILEANTKGEFYTMPRLLISLVVGLVIYKIQKYFQNVMLVGMARETSKNYAYKCVDRSRHNGIKGAKAKCAH